MEIVGRIDRVDVAEGENGLLLRVIDYKSSQTDLKLHEVYYGLSLQMLTYLEVLLVLPKNGLGKRRCRPRFSLWFCGSSRLFEWQQRCSCVQFKSVHFS